MIPLLWFLGYLVLGAVALITVTLWIEGEFVVKGLRELFGTLFIVLFWPPVVFIGVAFESWDRLEKIDWKNITFVNIRLR